MLTFLNENMKEKHFFLFVDVIKEGFFKEDDLSEPSNI